MSCVKLSWVRASCSSDALERAAVLSVPVMVSPSCISDIPMLTELMENSLTALYSKAQYDEAGQHARVSLELVSHQKL